MPCGGLCWEKECKWEVSCKHIVQLLWQASVALRKTMKGLPRSDLARLAKPPLSPNNTNPPPPPPAFLECPSQGMLPLPD